MKESYKEFQNLLRAGIGSRTQKEFAQEIGMSKEHLNRMLNSEEINRPSKATLESIAAHMNSVTISQLLTACGYDIIPVETRVVRQEDAMLGAIGDIIDTRKPWQSLNDVVDTLKLLGLEETGKIRILQEKETENFDRGESYAVMEVSWGDNEYCFFTRFALFYCVTKKEHILLTDVCMDFDELKAMGCMDRRFGYIRGEIIRCTKVTSARKMRELNAVEERLLRDIFGTEDFHNTENGYGFYYTETPKSFSDFLIEHKATFTTTKERSKLFQRIVTGENPDKVFVDYRDKNTECTGTGAVISEILRKETGYEFMYMKKDPDMDDDADDSCIVVPSESVFPEKIPKNALISIYQAAKTLNIAEFGTCYYKCYYKMAAVRYTTKDFHYEY